jgi:nicotinamidase-related amidase
MTAQKGPNRPQPQRLELDPKTTAIADLDLGDRFGPEQAGWLEAVGAFLERARAASVPIIHTIIVTDRGTPKGEVAPALKRRETEPVIYPDAFDKFMDPALPNFLTARSTQNLVIVGSSTNFAVLYTATTAARMYNYDVVVPLDGVHARSSYEQEYALHQLSVLPGGTSDRFRFTTLDMITFR